MLRETQPLLPRSGSRTPRRWAPAIAALLLAAWLLTAQLYSGHLPLPHWPWPGVGHGRPTPKRNMIFFVTDGMGPASLSLARSFRQHTEQLPLNDTLWLDRHLVGSSRTRSSDSLVTDSAAGATAFACARKSYNGAIGVVPLGRSGRYAEAGARPCGTLLEAAKLQGYATGLVVTTRITDATPGAFSAHADLRVQEDLIAAQQLGATPLGRTVDLMLGGGSTHFRPHGRRDGRDLLGEAAAQGWQVVDDMQGFAALQGGANVSLPLLALLAENDIPFDIDRNPAQYPSLEEEAMTAVRALEAATRDSDQGFFLLIEGSRIDHAGHQNDPAAQVREVLAFDRAFRAVMEWAAAADVETVMVSTSDHETGGLTAARQVTPEYPEYVWYPEVLAQATHSGEYVQRKIVGFEGSHADKRRFIERDIMHRTLNITDYTAKEIDMLARETDGNKVQDILNRMVSVRAQVGWTTHGHSAVDVNIYGYANTKRAWYDLLDHLQGNHENTEIGAYMEQYLQLDLDEVTERIANITHAPGKGASVESVGAELHDQYGHKLY